MEIGSKKSKILTSVVATALAASLLIGGGTFAYLQDETNDVVNIFETNQVTVDLEETTGNDYNIIPGTEEDKDPKVTVNNTVDSYVYVEVTDATDDLVDYTIAEGWTLLDGYDNVYYREVAADAEVKEFYVLDGNKVVYDAALQNSDMVDADGNLKEGLALTFKAYAIQKEPFADAVAAYVAKDSVIAADADTATEALAAGLPVVLSEDVTLPSSAVLSGAEINANGNTVTFTGSSMFIGAGETVTLKNGDVAFASTSDTNIQLSEGSVFNVEDVNMDMNGRTVFIPDGTQAATVNVVDSTVYTTCYYAISTNASNQESGKDIVINVVNSTLTADDPNGDCTAILMNVPGTLTITGSTINAGRQAVIVRTGTATITDSTLNNSLAYTEANWAKYDNARWGSGNEVPVAVLVVGDRATAYPHDASCTLNNVELNFGKETTRTPIYAAAYDGQTATVNGVSADMVTVSSDAGGVTVNP